MGHGWFAWHNGLWMASTPPSVQSFELHDMIKAGKIMKCVDCGGEGWIEADDLRVELEIT